MSFTENTASPVHVMKTEKNSPTMIHRNLTAELAVVGGGLAGVCAAIAAARSGMRVALIEAQGQLGGTAVSGLVAHWLGGRDIHCRKWVVNCQVFCGRGGQYRYIGTQ